MKKNILLAAMVAIFATSAFAQTTPQASKKEAKLEKKEDRITEHKAANEVKKEHKAAKKEEKAMHHAAAKEVKKEAKQSN
ncbi:hypothetical protein GCM10011514_24200 [Emticicia aquatilis]|uniref:Acid-shock protein n=1 Tax=Emticicia aquatilis TaxID=1537369 RepID=A0A917DQ51_9BACT|nr:hypothetical protein [Emticicia aquatilis]GGD59394.1 hypothetical protein GCM10011514_24200 [Emticicia aquatilis]